MKAVIFLVGANIFCILAIITVLVLKLMEGSAGLWEFIVYPLIMLMNIFVVVVGTKSIQKEKKNLK